MRYENLVRSLPAEFLDRMRRVSGADGKRWVEALPEIIETVSRRFGVGSLTPVDDPSYHFVAFAERRIGGSCVVKIGVADRDSRAEAAALEAFAGRGACTLFDEIDASADDPAYVALLLERCDPGRTLRDWRTLPERIDVAAKVFAMLHADGGPPPDGSAVRVASGYEDLLRGVIRRLGLSVRGICPAAAAPRAVDVDDRVAFTSRAGNEVLRAAEHLVECALPLVEDLRDAAAALLHGDLHHDNILLSGLRWVAIDPHGIVGPLWLEPGRFIINQYGYSDSRTRGRDLERLCTLFAGVLGVRPEQVLHGAVLDSQLSMLWSIEGGDPHDEIVAALDRCRALLEISSSRA